ncbi:MAG: hypothetical protein KDC34_16925 [Saprospiraceae bacterium]|nr:hypothetical protein [Saprospiraceae bacterium]
MHLNRIFRRKAYIAGIISILFLAASCIQFKTATLYNGMEVEPEPPKVADISMAVEPVIFADDATDVWGLETNECQSASVSKDVVFSGAEALEITWNRDANGCDFAGIGIGWDSYAGKDLSQIMDYVAIQMQVRTQGGRMFGLPIVLTLEDYSGGMGFAYTGNKYFERSAIDEEWQKVVVPLSAFDIEIENLDPSNIKQLQLELQQSGSIYLDDIRLVFYEPEPQVPWMEEEVLPNPIAFPIQVFGDHFINNNGWGIVSNECQSVKITDQAHAEGTLAISAKWNSTAADCNPASFGASWNKWFPVDVSSIREKAAFQFHLKPVSGLTDLTNISVGFEDYDRAKTLIPLKDAFLMDSGSAEGWKLVTVPFSALPKTVDFTRIKHLVFQLYGDGEIFIDSIQLVNIQ